jgi:hypothetical protein
MKEREKWEKFQKSTETWKIDPNIKKKNWSNWDRKMYLFVY